MQDRMKELGIGFAAALLASLLWQLGIVLLGPLSLLALVAWVAPPSGWTLGPETTITVTLGWMLSGVLAVIWFRNHSKARLERTLNLMSLMFGSDSKFTLLTKTNPSLLNEADIEQMAKELLSGMCQVLAYRVKFQDKGAMFLVLKSDLTSSGFTVFAKHNHPEIAVAETEQYLTRERGLVGRALVTKRVEVMKDCRRPPRHMEWFPTTQVPRFRGRAAVAVRAVVDGKHKDIGALCFDVKRPWRLSEEDQYIMAIFTVKLANLWALSNRTSVTQPTTQQAT